MTMDSQPSRRDPVAKNLNKFNKCARHKDKKNDYKRKNKIPSRNVGDYSL